MQNSKDLSNFSNRIRVQVDVKGGMTDLGGAIDLGAPRQQLGHDADVTLLGRQVNRRQSILHITRNIITRLQ